MFQSSTLAFYPTLDHQNRNRHWCSNQKETDLDLVFPMYEIPEFWIFRPPNTSFTDATLVAVGGQLEYALPNNGISFQTAIAPSSSDAIYFASATTILDETNPSFSGQGSNGPVPLTLFDWLEPNRFYLKILVNGDWLYSETFKFKDTSVSSVSQPCGYCSIFWTSTKDIEYIPYSLLNVINSSLYVAADVGLPEYEIDQDTGKDSVNDIYKTFQKLTKRSEIEFLANESLCDAISLIPLCDSVTVYNQYGEFLTVSDVELEIEWENSCIARVKMSYATDKFLRKNC